MCFILNNTSWNNITYRSYLCDIMNLNNVKMLEVCIDSLESAVNAIHGGADELEVCSSLAEGGLTPSAGLVKQVMFMVENISTKRPVYKTCSKCNCQNLADKPKVNVMIRCRTGSDFCYSNLEMDTMLSDIEIFKQMGVDRFVFGALLDNQVDEDNCKRVVTQAHPIPVTFHRAFDICTDPMLALNTVIKLGFNRVLTSGQKGTACQIEAVSLIHTLLGHYGSKIVIMPGSGITVDNARMFMDLGCKLVHSSCKVIKKIPKGANSLKMGSSDSETLIVTDESIVRKLKEVMNAKS